jgi:ABC-type branched-subunit amino acid transport system substrate-binding protein
VAALVGGCSTAGQTSATVSGTQLTIYASVPSQDADMLDAEKLALQQQGGTVGKFKIVLKSLSADSVKQVADNARTADTNTSTIAYVGEVAPGLSEQSVPITNELGILEVSPTDNAIELTEPSSAVSGSKNTYYPSRSTYGYTFGRMVPSASKEAAALVAEMQSAGVSKLYVTNDGSSYGAAIALAVSQDATGKQITVQHTASGADAAFIGSSDPAAAAKTFDSLASSNPTMKLYGSSSLANSTFAGAIGSTVAPNVYISSPGFLKRELSPADTGFAQSFQKAYGKMPSGEAIFGFAAMHAVLMALSKAGTDANNRTDVSNAFFDLNVPSTTPLGPFKMDSSGDTSLGTSRSAFVLEHLRAGQLVAFKSLPPPA